MLTAVRRTLNNPHNLFLKKIVQWNPIWLWVFILTPWKKISMRQCGACQLKIYYSKDSIKCSDEMTKIAKQEKKSYSVRLLTIIIVVIRHCHCLESVDGFLLDLLRLHISNVVIPFAHCLPRVCIVVTIHIFKHFRIPVLIDALILSQVFAVWIFCIFAIHIKTPIGVITFVVEILIFAVT